MFLGLSYEVSQNLSNLDRNGQANSDSLIETQATSLQILKLCAPIFSDVQQLTSG